MKTLLPEGKENIILSKKESKKRKNEIKNREERKIEKNDSLTK